jgi:hypothetical protein
MVHSIGVTPQAPGKPNVLLLSRCNAICRNRDQELLVLRPVLIQRALMVC